MKFNGQPLSCVFTQVVPLPRPDGEHLMLTLQPLPLGFLRQLKERGVLAPAPPTTIARDSQGKPIRDERGLAVLRTNESAAEFQIALDRYHQRVAVMMLAESLKSDPSITWETPAPTDNNWNAYADALLEELDAAGWTAGDLNHVCNAVCRLSNLLDDQLEAATENFSQAQCSQAQCSQAQGQGIARN